MAFSQNPTELDLTPASLNIILYEGTTSTLRVYRRAPGTLVQQALTGYTNPVAYWKAAKGDTDKVDFDAVISSDAIEVTITPAMMTAFTAARGFWRVEADNADDEAETFARGAVSLEAGV